MQQVDDLLLRRHVEAGGRLVQHDQIGLAGQRHGDADALLLPARELVRIAARAGAPDAGRPDQAEQLDARGGACA